MRQTDERAHTVGPEAQTDDASRRTEMSAPETPSTQTRATTRRTSEATVAELQALQPQCAPALEQG